MFMQDNEGDYLYYPIEEPRSALKVLPAGPYSVNVGPSIFFRPLAITQDGLISLNTTVARKVNQEVASFFDQTTRGRLAAAGVKNRRGIILHGPPGTGKTSLVRSLFETMVNHDAVILVDPNADYLENVVLPAIHLTDRGRSVVLFFDEFDRNASYSQEELKRLLDGLNSPDNLLTIGCTNHLERVPEALRARPSRFSLVLEMPAPDPKVREAFLRRKFPMIPADVASDLTTMIADKPLDYVQEVCVLWLRGMDVDEIRDRIENVPPSVLVMDDDSEGDDE
jgi:SpoVK/Ycf46/Vps4 family AAA+-type ATPase